MTASLCLRSLTAPVTVLLLCGCGPVEPLEVGASGVTYDAPAAPDGVPAKIDLRVRTGADAPYLPVAKMTVPADHTIGDRIFPYEGIGWENGLVGYRLYLDGRFVSDIFGKQSSAPALAGIGEHGSYHSLAPWGMDVLKVGQSLGIGGLGVIRNGEPTQFGRVSGLAAQILESGGDAGAFSVIATGIEAAPDLSGEVEAEYRIGRQSPLTRVKVAARGNLPLTTGIVMHDDAEFWQSASRGGLWRYLATWGNQSENKDGLGMALFYREDQARYGGLANANHFVVFKDNTFEYAFLAAWELDAQKITTLAQFERLLARELASLEGKTR